MTKVMISKPPDLEKQNLKDKVEEFQKVEEEVPTKCDKFFTFLTALAPLPAYALAFSLVYLDSCLNDSIIAIFFGGFFISVELCHFVCYFPSKSFQDHARITEVDYSNPEDLPKEAPQHSRIVAHHAFAVASVILMLDLVILSQLENRVPAEYLNWSFLPIFAISLLLVKIVVCKYIDGKWMRGHSWRTLAVSYLTLSFAWFHFALSILMSDIRFLYQGSFFFVGAMIHIRFNDILRFPPHRLCLLTAKKTRAFWMKWYFWSIALNSTLWAGLALLIIQKSQNFGCSENYTMAFIVYIASVLIGFISQIIMNISKSRASKA